MYIRAHNQRVPVACATESHECTGDSSIFGRLESSVLAMLVVVERWGRRDGEGTCVYMLDGSMLVIDRSLLLFRCELVLFDFFLCFLAF